MTQICGGRLNQPCWRLCCALVQWRDGPAWQNILRVLVSFPYTLPSALCPLPSALFGAGHVHRVPALKCYITKSETAARYGRNDNAQRLGKYESSFLDVRLRSYLLRSIGHHKEARAVDCTFRSITSQEAVDLLREAERCERPCHDGLKLASSSQPQGHYLLGR